jgi:O-antigen/teichoic acid export membrane protein
MALQHYANWFSQGAFSLLNRISTVLFGFLNVIIMVRLLPKQDIGIWVLFSSITAILEMVRAGFIRNPFITHLVSAEEKDKQSIVTSSLALHFLLAFALSFLLLISAGVVSEFYNSKNLQPLFIIYAVNNLLFIPFFHFEFLQTARLQFKAVFVSNVVRMGILTVYLGVIYFTSKETSLVDLAMVQLIATVLSAFIAYWYVKDVKMSWRIDRKRMADLFHFGKFTFGTNISSMFIRSTDTWMIGRMMSTAAVAIYNPALRLTNIFEVPTNAIASIIFPQVFSKMKKQGKEGVRNIYVKSVGLMLALTLPMALPLYFFSEFFIQLIFGREYIESATILQVTILYSLIIPFNRQFGTVMDGLKKPKLNFYLLVITAVINVVLNYIGLTYYGLIGSAYGTLISYGIVFTLNQIILYKAFKINTFKAITSIFEWYGMGWVFLNQRLVKAWQ